MTRSQRARPSLGAVVRLETLRRCVATTAGVAAVLTLSSAQFRLPQSVAQTRPDKASVTTPVTQGLPLAPGLPTWSPWAPSATTTPAPGTGPYGLKSSADFTSSGIPTPAHQAYVRAATLMRRSDPACGLNWSLIAGIGRVESNHGRFGGSAISPSGLVTPPILGIRLDGSRPGTARISDSDQGRFDGDTQVDRAVGPMQFLPATWRAYGGGADPQNIYAAALATGRYLCQGSESLITRPGQWAAVYRYNHSDSYVSLVLSVAANYATGTAAPFPSRPSGTPAAPDDSQSATPPGTPPAVPDPPVSTPGPRPTTSPTSRPTRTPFPYAPGTPGVQGTTGSPTAGGTSAPPGGGVPTGCPAPGAVTPTPSAPATPEPTSTPEPTPPPAAVTPAPSPTATGPAPSPSLTPGPGCATAADATA